MNRKTALEQLEYWIEQYYRINGTPTLDDIKNQINLLKDYEREQLHIAHVVGRSEQSVICKKCGSSEMYQYTKTKDKCEECGNGQDY